MGEDLDEASRMLDNAGERLYVLENELECKDDEIERLRAENAKLRAAAINLIAAIDAMHAGGETFTGRVSIAVSDMRAALAERDKGIG